MPLLPAGKRVLLVLFVPRVERDGTTPVDQNRWVELALSLLGDVFGGATACPRARGVCRDDERGRRLILDKPVVIHVYTDPEAIQDARISADWRRFAVRWVGRALRVRSGW